MITRPVSSRKRWPLDPGVFVEALLPRVFALLDESLRLTPVERLGVVTTAAGPPAGIDFGPGTRARAALLFGCSNPCPSPNLAHIDALETSPDQRYWHEARPAVVTASWLNFECVRRDLGLLLLHLHSLLSYIAVVAHVTTLGPLAELAQDQWGLITRRQARQAGVAPATMTRLIANGVLDRVASGVYRLAGAPVPDHLELRAAWLQLAPEVPAWERRPEQGVVSHRSAASLYGIGDLPADVHEFTMPVRRQTRRPDVRLHLRDLDAAQCSDLRGLPVTRPARIASDLLYDHQDPEAVGRIVVEATQQVYDYPGTFADTLGPHAFRFGFRRGDGVALLRWLYELGGDPDVDEWMRGAREHVAGGRRDEAVAP